ncbi:MAG: TrkA C-terminal domain-containing protein, partial [Candidatus Acidiferrales bacterium]
GVDITVSSTSIITSVIQSELPHSRIRQVLDLRAGQLELMEYRLDQCSPVAGKRLRDVMIPTDSIIVSITRDGQAIVPRGETSFAAGDVVLTLVKIPSEPALRLSLLGE